jgi:hypothetical protein
MGPDPICPRCSKPIRPGTGTIHEPPLHLGCWARAEQLRVVARRDRAGRETDRAAGGVDPAGAAIEDAKAWSGTCPTCGHDLKNGRTLLFQGDELVHAWCWRVTPRPAAPDPPPVAEAG